MIHTKEKFTNFKTQNMMYLNPDNFRDNICHCRIVEENEMSGEIHTLCGGIRTEEIKLTKKKRNGK